MAGVIPLTPNDEDKSMRFLALRALVVTILVLVALTGFERLNITAIGEDITPAVVEQSVHQS